MKTCLECKIDLCPICIAGYTDMCYILAYSRIIERSSIIPALKHVNYYPNQLIYLKACIEQKYPQYIDRIEKLMILI
jgi:hypothetical protein